MAAFRAAPSPPRSARAGRSVTVLERSTEYVDRVRGEYMHPWGVAEAQQLGVIDVLEHAGGVYLTRFVPYDECLTPDQAEASAVPLAVMVPNVPGALSLRHPVGMRRAGAGRRRGRC